MAKKKKFRKKILLIIAAVLAFVLVSFGHVYIYYSTGYNSDDPKGFHSIRRLNNAEDMVQIGAFLSKQLHPERAGENSPVPPRSGNLQAFIPWISNRRNSVPEDAVSICSTYTKCFCQFRNAEASSSED